jgi:hypothetical protein
MNLADYLSELLGVHDEVSVPGLGYFVRERINGYYNDSEAKFYPPHHRVKFVPDLREDDTFTQYVADKKNISLASSKYFAEKFIAKLRDDASRGTYIFAELGQFSMVGEQLIFKPYDKIAADPAFYGYEPVNIYKKNEPSFGAPVKSYFAEPEPKPVTAYTPPPQPVTLSEPEPVQEEYYEEEYRKRGISLWAILLIALVVLGVAAFGVYHFYPDKVNAFYNKLIGKQDTVATIKHVKAKDTVRMAPAEDTLTKTAPIIPSERWEIIESSFNKMPYAAYEVKKLKARGVADAKVLTDAPGPRIKISVGTFNKNKEADSVMKVLLQERKISNKSYLQSLPIQK